MKLNSKKTLFERFLLVVSILLITLTVSSCSSKIDTDRIDHIIYMGMGSNFELISDSDIDFILNQVDLMLDHNIKEYDRIIEESNLGKKSDIIMDLKYNIYIDPLDRSCVLLSVDIVQNKMSPYQVKKKNELEKKLESLKRRTKIVDRQLH